MNSYKKFIALFIILPNIVFLASLEEYIDHLAYHIVK